MPIKIPQIITSSENELIELFKDFHENPELGFEEYRTAKIVRDKLFEYGVDHVKSGIGLTGVVGVIKAR